MMKAFKVMLVPNKRQFTRLFQFAGTARFAYNWALRKEIDAYPLGVKYENPRISFDGLNWWLSVAVEFESEKIETVNETLGIDLGIKSLAVCSDGKDYPNINRTKTVRRLKKRQRRLQRKISRKYEMNKKEGGSYRKTRNIIKSEKKLLKVHHRLKNIRQNYRHQITSEIIKRKPSLIVLEDLNVLGMMSTSIWQKQCRNKDFMNFGGNLNTKLNGLVLKL